MEYNIKNLTVKDCFACDISLSRRSIVNGRGPITSKVMIVGESPGAIEDRLGIPFVGTSGQLLRKVLHELHIDPKDIFMTNIVKCKTPFNRTPSPIEVENCLPYFLIELLKLNPKLILLLGHTANKVFFDNGAYSMTKLRGNVTLFNDTILLSTYHPAYIMRNLENKHITDKFMADMTLFKDLLKYVYWK